jgi:hypothetical protein
MPTSKKGSFMFIAIEGETAIKRKEDADKSRIMLVQELWDITCCKENLFNRTSFIAA